MAKVSIYKESKDPYDPKNIRLWLHRIESNLDWIKKHWNGWGSWKAAYLLDRTIHWGTAEAIKEKAQDIDAEITVPIIANHIRNLMPFLFSKDPTFYGSPERGDTEDDLANTLAQLDYLNFMWRSHNMSRQARKAVLDAAIIGHGIAKTGWGYDLEIPTTDKPEEQGDINYLNYIKKDRPYVRRINPFLFLFDRTAPDSDLDSARWCCEIIITTIQDLIDNSLFDGKLRKKILTGEIDILKVHEFNSKYHEETQDDLSFLFKSEDKINFDAGTEIELANSLCIHYKLYDRKFGNVITLNPAYNKEPLRVDPWDTTNNHLDSFPFEKVDFEEVPNEPYGIGHTRYLADIQHQITRNRTKLFGISRMFNPKYTYKGSEPLAAEEQEKIKQDEAGVVVNLKPDGVIEEFPTPKASRDLYEIANLLDKDYSEVSGEDVLARGGLLPSRTSAEEVRERRRLRGLRLETNVENTHKFVLRLADQVLRHAQRYATQDMVVEVIGRPGIFFNRVEAGQIRSGRTRLKLEIISKEAEPPDVKRRNLMELFTIISNPNVYQLLQSQGVQINMKRLWKALMDTYDIDDLQFVFPGLNGDTSLPNLNLQNIGSPPGLDNGSTAESTRSIQSDNVGIDSFLQGGRGLEAIFANLNQGSINPSRF